MTIWGRIRTFLGRLRPTTIRVRAAALVALLVAVPLSGVAAVAALAVRASLLHQAAPDTRAAAENVALGYQGYDLDIMRSPCEKPLDLWNEAGAPGSVYRFCRWDSMPSAWKELLTGPKGGALSLWPFSSASAYRFVVPDTSEILGRAPDWVLLAENPLLREQTQLRTVVWSLVGAVAFVTALASASAWYAAGRVLRPMEAIRDEFAQLSTHHLDRRVPLPRTDNEISRLGRTLNTTLDRLHAALEQQQRFVADASHELRTPLAALRIELELALTRPATTDWPRTVRDALGDTLRLQRLAADLLLLARLDAEARNHDPHFATREHVDLNDLVRDEVARRHPPPHVALTLHLGNAPAHEPVLVHGHRSLLARVLGNLLDNAERHATSTVTVRLTHRLDQHQAVLEVFDDGPGIPPQHRTRVFERFTRLDDARTKDSGGGAGLGLALAHHITTLHHGTLRITDSPHGAHLTACLPTAADSQAISG
ncbi:Adaptive-response sensory-kinase SasA [Streptomyces antimycoticus]